MTRALVVIGLVALALSPAAPVAADDAAGGRGRVAIVPFAGDGRMALYGQPVAAQVARAGRAAGLDVVVLTAGAPVPADAALVVDGRLVKQGAAIVVEARVRDPERGLDVGRRSSTAATLAVVDRAADEVAAALLPVLRDGLAEQRQARARAAAALARGAAGGARTGGSQVGEPLAGPGDAGGDDGGARIGTGAAVAAVARRPVALIALTGALAGADGHAQGIAPLVAPSLLRLADGLGHRAAPLGEAGVAAPADAVVRAGASLAIVIAVLDVQTAGTAIPQGRARARVDVYDGRGLVFRRVVRTDTLIGSRGDRVDTLVRAAVAQIVDVVMPRLREHLARVPS